MSNIDKRALRKAAMHAKATDDWGCDADNFHDKATPDAVLALLDELEAKDQRIAVLEARESVVIIRPPVIGRAYSALNRVWTEQEVRSACELAGIKLSIAAAGKGE
ncbi:TPA: ead/Ea22-like family protein [Enterobacter roggenkampii]|nr:ead/Ea22-like family protein [Enterobacter roggenkampii]